MKLRIYRSWRWVSAVPDSEILMGGRTPMKLEAMDELQQLDPQGNWVAVPVVEAEKPPHPETFAPHPMARHKMPWPPLPEKF